MANPIQGEVMQGQTYDPLTGIAKPFVLNYYHKTASDAAKGTAGLSISPLHKDQYELRQEDIAYIQTQLVATVIKMRGQENLTPYFPDVLSGVSVSLNNSHGNGMHSETGAGFSGGDTASLQLHLSSTSSGSASLSPSVQPEIAPSFYVNKPVDYYLFYVLNDTSRTDVLARVTLAAETAVNEWPVFNPVAETILLQGQQASVRADADVQQFVSLSSGNTTRSYGTGQGSSVETGTTDILVRLPPTIHGQINLYITGTTNSFSTTTTASANANLNAAGNWPAVTAGSTGGTASVSALILPAFLPATNPASIPGTGLYLLSLQPDPFGYGTTRYLAKVVDFSLL